MSRDWPLDGERSATTASSVTPMVLVCRSNASGLTSAQHRAREYRDAEWSPRVRLLGAVVVADAPGRLPAPLRRAQRLFAAAVPVVWNVPWMPEWRLGPPDPTRRADWVDRLAQELAVQVHR